MTKILTDSQILYKRKQKRCRFFYNVALVHVLTLVAMLNNRYLWTILDWNRSSVLLDCRRWRLNLDGLADDITKRARDKAAVAQ